MLGVEHTGADFEGKLDVIDGKRVLLDHIANKLWIYDAEFHEYHYNLVDCIDDSEELEAQQKIFDEHDHRMVYVFTWITNLRSHEKIVTPPPKPAEKTISVRLYNYCLLLTTS